MKVAVNGLWHLGCVTAACLANANIKTLAYDSDLNLIEQLNQGSAPIFEPGLNELIQAMQQLQQLQFTSTINQLGDYEIVWVTFDTPVDENDQADSLSVFNNITKMLPFLQKNALIVISSQIPVGMTRQLQQFIKEHWSEQQLSLAVIPENLRLGKAIEVFNNQERIAVGFEQEQDKNRLTTLLSPFTDNIIWMSFESAEMTKHALNAFLAASVIFINEIALLCKQVGADPREVEIGLKSEQRIGPKAYLRPGGAIGGGTLLRDVNYLIQIAHQQQLPSAFFSGLITSNDSHKQWAQHKIAELIPQLTDKRVAILGLSYKAGTDTLRRSTAITVCEWLARQGAKVLAYDPEIHSLPPELSTIIELSSSVEQALTKTDAAIVTSESLEFSALTSDQWVTLMQRPMVLDANGFLKNTLQHDQRIHYYSVGN